MLGTLPHREFRSGLYEVVKYGVIADAGLFDYLEERNCRPSCGAILRAGLDHSALHSQSKADVVAQRRARSPACARF